MGPALGKLVGFLARLYPRIAGPCSFFLTDSDPQDVFFKAELDIWKGTYVVAMPPAPHYPMIFLQIILQSMIVTIPLWIIVFNQRQIKF